MIDLYPYIISIPDRTVYVYSPFVFAHESSFPFCSDHKKRGINPVFLYKL
uniref:Uncharacterized protein n=1 Tax=Candidatus Kentrum sp. MB TaxID=2138164 RepID=A0A450XIJ3_9GAMM|nr:MAG: hypothetical protein BECKMB1821G_GA0114241_104515 [Candidatus Kentron sp. MB]VFK30919.1 MAG: hypothetical protein BECKMB1821I_GA0114274_101912 [Candidatus Kentron sp. MB]VFK75739.1 MAG: hypothetical protein BECKMB1821H_GA0114242_103022 [Candidatus Kentron sp. MB]